MADLRALEACDELGVPPQIKNQKSRLRVQLGAALPPKCARRAWAPTSHRHTP